MGEEAAARERLGIYLAGFPHTTLAKPEAARALLRRVHIADARWFAAHRDALARLRPYVEGEFWPSHDARWTSVLVRQPLPGVRLREPAAPHPLVEGQTGVALIVDAEGRVWRQEGAMSAPPVEVCAGEEMTMYDPMADRTHGPTPNLWGDATPPAVPSTPPVPPVKAGKGGKGAGNPMLARYGAGPQGVTCADCAHLRRDAYHDYAYYKCRLRGVSGGQGSDHRKGWPACARYTPDPDDAAPPRGGHTLAADWSRGLPRPSTLAAARVGAHAATLTCPHCGLLLGFHAWERGHAVTYGVRWPSEYDREVTRCPNAPITSTTMAEPTTAEPEAAR